MQLLFSLQVPYFLFFTVIARLIQLGQLTWQPLFYYRYLALHRKRTITVNCKYFRLHGTCLINWPQNIQEIAPDKPQLKANSVLFWFRIWALRNDQTFQLAINFYNEALRSGTALPLYHTATKATSQTGKITARPIDRLRECVGVMLMITERFLWRSTCENLRTQYNVPWD